MPDYQLGKIYLITSETNKLLYIGSTAQKYLSTRIQGHIANYKSGGKYCCSQKVLDCDDYNYKLLKDFPCSNIQQLRREEGFWILHYKNQNDYECVNKQIAGRTMKEYRDDNRDKAKEYHKEYREENRDKIKELQKEYRETNKEYHKEYKKEWYDANRDRIKEKNKKNRDKIKEYNKEYREANRDKAKAYQKEYYKNNKDKIKDKK